MSSMESLTVAVFVLAVLGYGTLRLMGSKAPNAGEVLAVGFIWCMAIAWGGGLIGLIAVLFGII